MAEAVDAPPDDHTALPLKVLVLGDGSVGKTAYIRKLVRDEFTPRYKASAGVDFALKELEVDGRPVRVQVWDVAGAHATRGGIADVYYKDAFGALLLYDVTRPTTFDTVLDWKKEIDACVEPPDGSAPPVVLLGTKCDIETANARTPGAGTDPSNF